MREFIHNYDHHVNEAFDEFKDKHGKTYDGQVDHTKRKELFRQNMRYTYLLEFIILPLIFANRHLFFSLFFRYIHSTNRANLGYQLGVNHLADRTELELKALRGKQYSGVTDNGGDAFPHDVQKEIDDAPESMDWRLYGAVTPVKGKLLNKIIYIIVLLLTLLTFYLNLDQSVCGSCWSFGSTGAVEGAYFMKYGHLVRLSQQVSFVINIDNVQLYI